MKTYLHFDDPRRIRQEAVPPIGYVSPSDAELTRYVERYWFEFRSVVEQYFGDLAAALPLYANYPYATTIVRVGCQGVLRLENTAHEASVSILRAEDFDPPLATLSVWAIRERLGEAFWTPDTLWTFDARFRSYSDDEARIWGTLNARIQALNVFWEGIEPASFESLCRDLVVAEGLSRECLPSGNPAADTIDLIGKIYLDEPGRIVREETWGFQIIDQQLERSSASTVSEAVEKLERNEVPVDVLCLVFISGLTSIALKIASESARIRIWDRTVIDHLLHQHPKIMERYFRPYAEVLERLQGELEATQSVETMYRAAFQECSTGQRHFRRYEDLGVEILRFLFPTALGEPHIQSRTDDGVERRDVVCRNHRSSRFFQRVRERFAADFVIWDFKNYEEPVTGQVINDVAPYANSALGRFIVVVSRYGGDASARAAQLRRLRNDQTMILVVSDQQLLEMIHRKEAGDAPEDLLEDLLDEVLLAF